MLHNKNFCDRMMTGKLILLLVFGLFLPNMGHAEGDDKRSELLEFARQFGDLAGEPQAGADRAFITTRKISVDDPDYWGRFVKVGIDAAFDKETNERVERSITDLGHIIGFMYRRHLARSPGETGSVVLSVTVNQDGSVAESTVVEADSFTANFPLKVAARVKLHEFHPISHKAWNGVIEFEFQLPAF